MAKVLYDWQYEDMYKQHAMAIPAITQLVLEDVLRTNRAANGIVIAYEIKMKITCPNNVRGNTMSVVYSVRFSFLLTIRK